MLAAFNGFGRSRFFKGRCIFKTTQPSEQVDSSKRADSSKQSDQKPVKRRKHLTDSKHDTVEADWAAAREVLARETRAYLKAARKLSRKDDASSKQFASAAKPVYKALKPSSPAPTKCALSTRALSAFALSRKMRKPAHNTANRSCRKQRIRCSAISKSS